MQKKQITVKNPSRSYLIEKIIEKKEGNLLSNGTVNVDTRPFTGRSPKDKYIVEDSFTKDKVWWGPINQPTSKETFISLRQELKAHLDSSNEVYIMNGYAGFDDKYRVNVQLITCSPVQALAYKNLVIPADEEKFKPELTIYASPYFSADKAKYNTNSDVFIIMDMSEKEVIIGKTVYPGEIKKSIFTYMNFALPLKGVFSMHCSANTDSENKHTALFFGLSGTGKTTLSVVEDRLLIGDDEHAWHDEGIFNYEGGSYAKIINVSEDENPMIYHALKYGVMTENVVFNDQRIADYSDQTITENTRACIPLDMLENVKSDGKASHPETIFFLSADAFGILPPIAKLEEAQIYDYFLLGYTAKLAGTERGVKEPSLTFSECFGKPFIPLNPKVYAQMLLEKVKRYGAEVYLVNTGWIGGAYGTGSRIKLRYTKRLVNAAINRELKDFEKFEILDLKIPKVCEGVPSEILNPSNVWTSKSEYEKKAKELYSKFKEHFEKF